MKALAASDWSFARRPFWLFSHVFAATMVTAFVALGVWQYSRHLAQGELNELIAARSGGPAADLAGVIDREPADLDYQVVEGAGTYLDGAVVHVANRTQGGVAGRHAVGLFQLESGTLVLVNRGFVPIDPGVEVDPAPAGLVEVRGWLRATVDDPGMFGAVDSGEGELVPRLDVAAIAGRLDPALGPVAPVWLQLAGGDTTGLARFPDPVVLPPVDPGPHLGYMGQWFIFATLGIGFYSALLHRHARGRGWAAAPAPEPMPSGPTPNSG